jgi:hypothetical protein
MKRYFYVNNYKHDEISVANVFRFSVVFIIQLIFTTMITRGI